MSLLIYQKMRLQTTFLVNSHLLAEQKNGAIPRADKLLRDNTNVDFIGVLYFLRLQTRLYRLFNFLITGTSARSSSRHPPLKMPVLPPFSRFQYYQSYKMSYSKSVSISAAARSNPSLTGNSPSKILRKYREYTSSILLQFLTGGRRKA